MISCVLVANTVQNAKENVIKWNVHLTTALVLVANTVQFAKENTIKFIVDNASIFKRLGAPCGFFFNLFGCLECVDHPSATHVDVAPRHSAFAHWSGGKR